MGKHRKILPEIDYLPDRVLEFLAVKGFDN
jgi:hypothetical protein